MELLKKHIHMNRVKCRSSLQFTLDDDFNVPDAKPDVASVITVRGEVRVEEERFHAGKYYVKGTLPFTILYLSDESEQPVQNIPGELSFDEVLHVEEGCEGDGVRLNCIIEDISASMIHSRKLSVKALLRLRFEANELYDESCGVEMMGDEPVESLTESMTLTATAVNRRDFWRLKESTLLPSGKPSIQQLLYNDLCLHDVEIRLQQDQFTMKGSLELFCLYEGEESDGSFEALEQSMEVSTAVEVSGVTEDMIPHIVWRLHDWKVTAAPDSDGEERILEIEGVVSFDIQVYEEESCELLADVYSTSCNLQPVYNEAMYENLLVKNSSKLRVGDKLKLPDGYPRILQICHGAGEVKVEEVNIADDGLMVDGVVDVSVFYISGDDRRPLQVMKTQIPFSQKVEANGMRAELAEEDHTRGYHYEVWPAIDQISVTMLDAEEAEIRAAINLNVLVMEQLQHNFLVDYTTEPFDEAALSNLPGAICYYTMPGDTLWSIAKSHDTTIEKIRQYNEAASDTPSAGTRLLLIPAIR